jgi:hypothetical protein
LYIFLHEKDKSEELFKNQGGYSFGLIPQLNDHYLSFCATKNAKSPPLPKDSSFAIVNPNGSGIYQASKLALLCFYFPGTSLTVGFLVFHTTIGFLSVANASRQVI